VLTCFLSLSTISQTRIIFDTDFGGDADDLGALAMLHHFVDSRECELMAIMCWSTEKYAVAGIDAVNRYYNHPDIPIGARKDSIQVFESNYSKAIADRFPHALDHTKVSDAVKLYRKLLAESADQSVVVVTVGPLKNIENLLRSEGDELSPLNGEELIRQKVSEFVMMGGQFPEGKWEWNFAGGMPGVTQYVLSHLEVPVTFSGFELGVQIKTGEVFNRMDRNTPLYVGFLYFSEHAPWMKMNFKGEILDNSTFDQTAVLYAVRNGDGTFWEKVSNGVCVPDENGGNTWKESQMSTHSYLRLTMKPEQMAELIEQIMLGEL
jgi:inosine-uridine nucleoside N-ribohydrolase